MTKAVWRGSHLEITGDSVALGWGFGVLFSDHEGCTMRSGAWHSVTLKQLRREACCEIQFCSSGVRVFARCERGYTWDLMGGEAAEEQ